jgi:hypothetical protein
MGGVSASKLRWVLLGVLLAAGFFYWVSRNGATLETGRVDSKGNGGGSIITNDWTYGFSSDVAWTDRSNTLHDSGLSECLPPLSSVEDVRFAWVQVTIQGVTWRQVVWIDCQSVPQTPSPTTASVVPGQTGVATTKPISGQPAANLIFRTAEPPSPPPPSVYVGCVGGGLGPFTLHGIESGSEVLVWLEQDDHRQFAAVWPNGFPAEFNPELELRDAQGKVVAREGDIIEGGGGHDEYFSNLLHVWSFNGLAYPCS